MRQFIVATCIVLGLALLLAGQIRKSVTWFASHPEVEDPPEILSELLAAGCSEGDVLYYDDTDAIWVCTDEDWAQVGQDVSCATGDCMVNE